MTIRFRDKEVISRLEVHEIIPAVPLPFNDAGKTNLPALRPLLLVWDVERSRQAHDAIDIVAMIAANRVFDAPIKCLKAGDAIRPIDCCRFP